MRRIIYRAVLSALVVLICAVSAWADASLFRGSGNIGSVLTIDDASGLFVPVEDVGRLLGFKSSRKGEELVLTRGNAQLRVIEKSAAAWRGFSIVSLYSAPFERNGKLWVDAQSAATLFQPFAGGGQDNKLRFLSNKGALAQNAADKKPYSLPVPATPPKQTTTPETVRVASVPDVQPKQTTTPETVRVASVPEAQPKPAIVPVVQEVSDAPTIAELPASNDSEQEAASRSSRTKQTQQTQQKAKTPETPQTVKKQPRLETFRPGTKGTEKATSYSGTIQKIRWTHSEGAYNKIMAVVDTDDNADPQVYISGNSIHALFADCLADAEGLTSPYNNIKTQVKKSAKGVELIFALKDFLKAEKLVLNDPRRIAFDFFYSDEVSITPANPSPALQASQPPARQTPQIPAAPVTTTPRRQSTAVTTPPSTITIPMTPGSTKRKTVVIDPGHGGKDPGASDNGVQEKNVNLAVGLELERALSARGYRVVMTRNTDVYLTLQERTDIANRENADLFVSIHVNALPNKKSMSGFEIYIMALPTDTDAMNLAKVENREYVEGKGMDVANVDRRTEMLLKILGDMQQNNKISESTDFAAALYNSGVINGLQMRRIAQAPFFVLRGAGMPAVLLEIGFVTNLAESRLITTPAYQQKIANAMSAGIMNYLK